MYDDEFEELYSYRLNMFPHILRTLRVGTSTAPNLRKVKGVSYAWKSLSQNVPQCPLSQIRAILKISWKSVSVFIRNVTNKHEFPRQNRNEFLCPNVTYQKNVPVCSLSQVRPMLKISRKSVHPFFRKVANRHTNKPTEMNITFAVCRR